MHFGLSPEQEMIVSTVRSFVENEIYPHEAMVERTGQVPLELGEEIKRKVIDLGFYACNFPESVGGAGLSHLDITLVERELGRGSMALTHFFGRPQNILMACEGEQRERYLLPAVRGDKMDALAMTEPDAGSDVRGMKCTATADGISSSFLPRPGWMTPRMAPKNASPAFWWIAGLRGLKCATGIIRSATRVTKTTCCTSTNAGCPPRRCWARSTAGSM